MRKKIYRLKKPEYFEEDFEEIKEDGIIVRPTYLSICKADQRYFQGNRPPDVLKQKLPMALIHEGIGEIFFDETGTFDEGEIVVMIPNTPIEEDIYRANYSFNSKFRGSGFDGFTSNLVKLDKDRLVKIPEDFNFNVSAFIELISVSYQGIEKFLEIATTPIDRLGVWGDGNVGFITALLLKTLCPDSKIIVFGKHQYNLSLFTFVDEIYKIYDIPDDIVIDHGFECVGSEGSQSAISQIIDLINPQGTISLFGVSELPIDINTRMVLEKGLTMQGNSRSEREDFINVVNLLKENNFLFDNLNHLVTNVCEIYSIEDLEKAFDLDYNTHFGKTVLKFFF